MIVWQLRGGEFDSIFPRTHFTKSLWKILNLILPTNLFFCYLCANWEKCLSYFFHVPAEGKAFTQHDAATTTFHHEDGVFIVMYIVFLHA